MQNSVQQRIMNLYLSIVADESKFAEFVHKVAHPRQSAIGGILAAIPPPYVTKNELVPTWIRHACRHLG
jgi:hypothetical protein